MAPETKIFYPNGVEITALNKALKPLGAKVLENPQDSLKQAIAEYQKDVRTPELITDYWRAKLQADAENAGLHLSIEIPPCNWTEEEIRRPMKDINGNDVPGIMVPVIDTITLPVLGRIYPKMEDHTVQKDTFVKDTHDAKGWVKVCASIDAPNLNTPQRIAEEFAEQQGYLGQRLITYILAAQASKDLTGRYLDEGFTWSWLTGSRGRGGVVCACFLPDGRLGTFWYLPPEIPYRYGGWCFEEVKRV